jgi:replicative DNA helicase
MAESPLKIGKDPFLYHVPPQSLEAEESILSAILVDNDTLPEILEILSPKDFYRSSHQKMFTAITELFSRNEPVDLVTLTNILRERGWLEEIGGATYLANLVDTVPLAVNAQHYAKIVHDKACLRQLIEKSNAIAKRCYRLCRKFHL